ncbi:MAG: GNAT family N-acetyltransferase [Cellulosilyticaceae bacterium]
MSTIQVKKYEQYKENEILALYNSVGWVNYTNNPQMLRNAYKGSLAIVGAYEDEKLVGIIRVVGDGHSIIYIQDIIVLPEYQRRGIGSLMLKEILSVYAHVYQKILLTDNQPNTVAFYKQMAFTPDFEMGCVAFAQFTIASTT